MAVERDLVYLACPYSHKQPSVREARFKQVSIAAAHVLKQGHIVYSPITHSHPMAEYAELPGDWAFWSRIDETYLRHSRLMLVLALDGWDSSMGVRAEIELAGKLNVPVFLMDQHSYEIQWGVGGAP